MNIEHFPEKKVFQTVVDGETARLMYHVADGALDPKPFAMGLRIEHKRAPLIIMLTVLWMCVTRLYPVK